jgi:hypothetical protein
MREKETKGKESKVTMSWFLFYIRNWIPYLIYDLFFTFLVLFIMFHLWFSYIFFNLNINNNIKKKNKHKITKHNLKKQLFML